MNFYFCETCGKRLTEKDLNEGAARNKKLKGVFCRECAIGVSTLDTIPMSDKEAREVVEKAEKTDPSGRLARRRTSASRIPRAGERRASERHRQSERKVPSTRSTGPNPLILVGGGVGLAAICVVGLLVFRSPNPPPKKRITKKTRKMTTRDDISSPVPANPTKVTTGTGTPTSPGPTSPKPADTTTPTVPTVDYSARWDTAKKEAEAALEAGDLTKAWEGVAAFSREVSSLPKAGGFKAGIEAFQKKIADAAVGQVKKVKEEVEDDFNAERQRLSALKASLPAELARQAELDKALADVDDREKAFKESATAKMARQQALVKAENRFRDFFDAFNQSVMKQDYAEAGNIAQKAKADGKLGDFAKAAAALEPVNRALMKRSEVEQQKLKALVGKKFTFLTKRKSMTGTVWKIEGDVIKISVEGKINNQTIEYGRDVRLSDLKPAGLLKIFGPFKPGCPDEWVAKAVRLMAMRDLEGTEKALDQAKDHPLAPPYLERVKDAKAGAAESAAKRFWEKHIEPMRELARNNRKATESVKQLLEAFFAQHGKTDYARKAKKRLEVEQSSADWPCWRGPDHNGVAPRSPKLLDAWPEGGPPLLWKSDKIPGADRGGVSHPIVADGKVFVYVNWRHPLGTQDDSLVRPFTAEVLADWGWLPDLPEDLAKKIEEARVSPQRPKWKAVFFGLPRNAQDQYIANGLKAFRAPPAAHKYVNDFLATLDASAVQKYGAYIKRRLYQNGLSLEQLGRLAAIAEDETFPADYSRFHEELKKRGFDLYEELKKCGLGNERGKRGRFRSFEEGAGKPTWFRAFKITDTLVCLDAATGKELWKTELSSFDMVDRFDYGGFKRGYSYKTLTGMDVAMVTQIGSVSTPAIWNDKCFVKGLTALSCLSVKDGKVLWQVERGGTHGSVLVADGVVYAGGEAFVAQTGKSLWKGGGRNDRSSPVLWTSGQNRYVISESSCLDLRTGKELWKAKWSLGGGMTPMVSGDVLVASDAAYKLSLRGAEKLWAMPKGRDQCAGACASHVVYQNHVYWYGDWFFPGSWWCLDLETGKVVWKEKSPVRSGCSISSAVVADGKIIKPVGNGHRREPYEVVMVKATPEKLIQLGVFNPGVLAYSSPAIAGGKLYLRLSSCITCYDLMK